MDVSFFLYVHVGEVEAEGRSLAGWLLCIDSFWYRRRRDSTPGKQPTGPWEKIHFHLSNIESCCIVLYEQKRSEHEKRRRRRSGIIYASLVGVGNWVFDKHQDVMVWTIVIEWWKVSSLFGSKTLWDVWIRLRWLKDTRYSVPFLDLDWDVHL